MSYMEAPRSWDAEGKATLFTGISGDAQVRTPCGPRRIEFLRPGDLIVTRDNGLQPIRMIWTTQSADFGHSSRDIAQAPVRLEARAVGPMMPQTPVLMAPDHRVLVPSYLLCDVDGVGGLLEARSLAGTTDAAYFYLDGADATFYNIVFDQPQVILVQGLPVETFHVTQETIAQVPSERHTDLARMFPALRGKGQISPPLKYPRVAGEDYLPTCA